MILNWKDRNEWNRNKWFTGPSSTYWTARMAGKAYEVAARYEDAFARSGPVVYWSHDNNGTNKRWATKDEAMAWCAWDAKKTATANAALRRARRAAPEVGNV